MATFERHAAANRSWTRWATFLIYFPLAALWAIKASEASGISDASDAYGAEPCDLVWDVQTERLWVANGRAGTLLEVNPANRNIRQALQRPSSITKVSLLPKSSMVVALEPAAGKLHFLAPNASSSPALLRSIDIGSHVVDITFDADGDQLFVLHRWRHQATLWKTEGADKLNFHLSKKIDLPFAPLTQVVDEARDRWIIGAAFGGRLMALNAQSGEVLNSHNRPIHNIRDMALSPDGQHLWLTHQHLYPEGTTLRGDIQWGFLMENRVRSMAINASPDQWASVELLPPKAALEQPGNAAGDPEAILWTNRQECLVTLAGVGELAVFQPQDTTMLRMGVGKRPVALAYDPVSRTAFVANRGSGSISTISMDPEIRVSGTIRLGPKSSKGLTQKGEALFHDAHLSFHGWFSCHSCHTDGHANGRLNDNEADGSFGAPKKVLPLGHVAKTGPWSWLGSRQQLSDEIHRSILTTMREVPSEEKEEALLAYMKTLEAPPPKQIPSSKVLLKAGKEIFEKTGCVDCHVPPYYTDAATYHTGIEDEQGNRRFNPPSLLGVSHRVHLLHDGRADSLRNLLTEHQHMLSNPLPKEDLESLIIFLESL